jgi:hypothetical protein
MFVRWKTRVPWRAHKDFPHRNPGTSFSAVLVRSERREGEPRQRIVAHLGHITEDNIDSNARQLSFWQGVDRHLDALTLSPEDRRQIEAQVRARIPRPTPEEVERDKHETLERLSRHFRRL